MAIYSSPAAQTLALAKAYVAATALITDRAVYTWPQVQTTNGFDPTNAKTTVDGNSFMASNIAQHAPHLSPGGASSRLYLGGILELLDSSATIVDYDELNAAGVAPMYIDNVLGAIVRKGVTCSTTAGKLKISRRRMADFILSSIGQRGLFVVEEPLDIVLSPPALGPVTGSFVNEATDFLQGLLDAAGGPQISGYNPVDGFSSNVQANIDLNQWFVVISVSTLGSIDDLIILGEIGETVQLTEAA